jgi:hypothetical protein
VKQYQTNAFGSFQLVGDPRGTSFGPHAGNADYQRMMAEVASGEAEILPVPAPDPLLAWNAEMARLDAAVLADARYWEEVASGSVSAVAASRMGALIAARVAHRSVRP